MDLTQRLPAELVSRCFEFGHDYDSFAASPALGVCRGWRKFAIASPLYWRELTVDFTTSEKQTSEKQTRARIFTLGARLRNSRPDCAASVKINARTCKNVTEPTEQVLLHIGVHMPRIKRLAIRNMPFSVMKRARATFLEHAPQLEELDLSFTYGFIDLHIPEFPLWADMFSGNAPRLRSLDLRNIRIRPQSVWPLGEQITSLCWIEDEMEAPGNKHLAIPAPLWLFPNLQALRLTTFSAVPNPLPNLSQIRNITADGESAYHAHWAALALATSATVRNPSSDIARQVVGHLWQEDPLDLCDQNAPQSLKLLLEGVLYNDEMDITVTETGNRRFVQRMRRFRFNRPGRIVEYDDFGDWVGLGHMLSSPMVLLGYERLTDAVVSLELHWETLPTLLDAVSMMPRLESVILSFPSRELSERVLTKKLPAGQQLQCPNLREVVARAARGWRDTSPEWDRSPSPIVSQEEVRKRIAIMFSTSADKIVFV